jgi:uncharacterized protein YjbI with pentapeptide repeats
MRIGSPAASDPGVDAPEWLTNIRSAETFPMTLPAGTAPEDLTDLLRNHGIWAATDGAQGERADLSGMNLAGRAFWRGDLRRALLDGANLAGANLDHADLRGASLQGAKLSSASLWEVKLAGADLRDADLRDAKLDHADLRGADLTGADMTGASLKSALLDDKPASAWGTDFLAD